VFNGFGPEVTAGLNASSNENVVGPCCGAGFKASSNENVFAIILQVLLQMLFHSK